MNELTRLSASTLVVLTMLLGAVFPARADWRFDAETGAFYDNNLSRSDRAADEKDDWAWQSEAHAGYSFQLARDLRLNLSGDLREQVWMQFDAFDNVAVGGSAGLRYRFGLGRQAPWLLTEDLLSRDFFSEDNRSGWNNRFRVRGGIALTDRLALEARYTFEHFAATDRFFDQQGHRGGIRLAFDVTSALQLALGYEYRNGNVISYAVPPRPDILLLTSERRPVTSFDSPYVAYRLNATTHTISASVAYAVNKFVSVQLAYNYALSCHDPLQYENHLVETKVAFAY